MQQLLLHPTSLFALLVLGVLLSALTFRVVADSYAVHAVVAARPLQEGAVIQRPVNGQTLTVSTTAVSGYCPDEAYVKLFRNGMFSGVAACTDNTFTVHTSLFAGYNELHAQAFDITDNPGPRTDPVGVTSAVSGPYPLATGRYTPPLILADAATNPAAHPLLLEAEYGFFITRTSESFTTERLRFVSGTPPYRTSTDWGDGSPASVSVVSAEVFNISHRYAGPGYYPVRVQAQDSRGRQLTMQLAAVVKRPGDVIPTGGAIVGPASSSSISAGDSSGQWLQYAWPTYGVLIIMVVSFWLGERREYLKLVRPQPAYGQARVRR